MIRSAASPGMEEAGFGGKRVPALGAFSAARLICMLYMWLV